MCTVVALNATGGRLILAGNRDELRSRSRAQPPSIAVVDGVEVIWPIDPDGGGTWTAATAHGLAFSLLNSYEVHYEPPAPVASRGRLIPALATSRDLAEVEHRLTRRHAPPLSAMRPFALRVAAHADEGARALAVHWDGQTLQIDDWPLPAVAVSSGVDLATATASRGELLAWLFEQGGDVDLDDVKDAFAQHGPFRSSMSVCMHSPLSHTVSHTQIQIDGREVRLRYVDGSPCRADFGGEWAIGRA